MTLIAVQWVPLTPRDSQSDECVCGHEKRAHRGQHFGTCIDCEQEPAHRTARCQSFHEYRGAT